MPEFLSAAWFAAVDGTDLGTDPTLSFDLDQVVTGAPGGDVRYRAAVRDGRLHVATGPAGRLADATLRMTYTTAVALATGRRTADEAFRRGDVRFTGDLRRLQELTLALAAIGGAVGAVHDRTTYPVSR